MITGIEVTFKNHPKDDGTFETFAISDCLISNNGSPSAARPQILIHLPATDTHTVNGSFVEYDSHNWHVIGTTAPQMAINTPTRWNRYAIAERIQAL